MTKGISSKKKNELILRGLGILISVISIGWVLHNFEMSEVSRAIRGTDYRKLCIVLLIILVSYTFRSLRWGILFGRTKSPRKANLFAIMMIGYLANNVLPGRVGELIRSFMLGQSEDIPKSTVFGTVIVERVFDLVTLMAILSVILMWYPLPGWAAKSGLLIGIVSIVAVLVLIILNYVGYSLLSVLLDMLSFLPLKFLYRIKSIGEGFIMGVTGLRGVLGSTLFFMFTCIIWLCEMTTVWIVAQACHLDITLMGALFVLLFVGLGTLVPSSPGYLGTYEFFSVSALKIVGITGNAALSFSLILHAIGFLWTNIIGVICLFSLGLCFKSMKVAYIKKEK
jgi:uncharacterized protein (TIRG00374 family)